MFKEFLLTENFKNTINVFTIKFTYFTYRKIGSSTVLYLTPVVGSSGDTGRVTVGG